MNPSSGCYGVHGMSELKIALIEMLSNKLTPSDNHKIIQNFICAIRFTLGASELSKRLGKSASILKRVQ